MMPALVGAIAFTESAGQLVVALADRIALYDWALDRLATLADLPGAVSGHRFNDGRCDRQGRFWVGTMHNISRAPEGALYRLDEGGLAEAMSGICIPNSLAWSPDGRVMYFADSLHYSIARHDYDTATGTMGSPSIFAATTKPGFPDGSTVDADGYLWNAEFNASRVVRYAPDGRIDRLIPMPVDRPTACAFGGADLDLLYVTTTSQGMNEAELGVHPLAGALLAFEAGVRGLPEPLCTVLPTPLPRSDQP